MRKRIVSLWMAVCLLAAVAFPAFADTESVVLKITTAEEFLQFAENCRLDSYSQGLQVTLEKDIDLTGMDFAGVPIFSGSFDGKGHSISGLDLTADGSTQGLFRYVTVNGAVANLTVRGQLHPAGSRNAVGGIAGENSGSITNCNVNGSISGGKYVGGIVGINRVTGIIDGCTVAGEVHGDHFVGGVAGSNAGVIRGCKNAALINTTPQQNSVEISDITMDTLLNTEDASTATDIGGIAGNSSGVIKECENRGDVGYPQMGYNIGGIVGSQSGYLADCQNEGSIQGRKEVGGIVGQMEPVLLTEFSTDTLQILERQLEDLSSAAGQAASSAKNNAVELGDHMTALQEQVDTARDALEVLTPDPENPADPDALLAAQNALADALNGMPGSLKGISSAAESLGTDLTQDLNRLYGKIGAMEQTINAANENLGGSFLDASDEDTEEELTGKVERCVNSGTVLADRNVGGIAGAMGVENDLDILEDWQQSGDTSLNFQSKVRVVILDCENRGTVTCKKQYGGGIVGWQMLGLVKNCTNTGQLNSTNASYVGGIAGWSQGYLRSDFVKCQISAGTNVGGIAGSGAVVTDCISMVRIENGKEKLGAVLGEMASDTVTGNVYLVTGQDMGAIDGISYSSLAEPMMLEEFLMIEGLPAVFQAVTMRFVFADGTQQTLTLTPGSRLTQEQIPQIPERAGFSGSFQGLKDADLSHVLFDMTFTVEYAPYRTVIETETVGQNGAPVFLVEGSFTDDAVVTAAETAEAPTLKWRQTHLESWVVKSAEGGTRVRFLAPDGEDLLLLARKDGAWQQVDYTRDGSYLVFNMDGTEMTVALVKAADYSILYCLLGGAVLIAAALVTVLLVRKHKKKIQMAN